ncbi:MAG: bifunctional diaminohydroxyphosphoribosylaminopyrimidine deaminase/5-amino-6-(5-phosphoribosylamino)uracil reductase RibD, partial [Planctomycetota bacterium]|nr:bifunctional diaminohydroxyphosphoribosylaminopyrimidine deaminase/5-amino-6-(5-phosphoribosylamino)uracil reductase RibD [Planctomycetota bacterium]
MADHETFMLEALSLARRGRGWTSPNPVVGALIVRDGRTVGRGWHKQFGGPHAEVVALAEAGEQTRGATLYCTLEPCNHTGKTPPCVQAVIRAGIAAVVLGAPDPNPVAAGGAAALRAAGISVVTGICEEQCRTLNAPFFKCVATGLPLVSVKWAMT